MKDWFYNYYKTQKTKIDGSANILYMVMDLMVVQCPLGFHQQD